MSLRDTAMQIWTAGLDAVRAERLIDDNVRVGEKLTICGRDYPIDSGKLCVVGAGKASGYLAMQLERQLADRAPRLKLSGLVNVPENCVQPTNHIRLHGARPAGVNEPTKAGVEGTQQILEMVASLAPEDLCICLLTGGGSALLPATQEGLLLEDKLAVIRLMSSRGATIQDLNRVRIALSRVKGGGLARACRAGRLVSLIISDVIGDPIDLIASGPTVLRDAKSDSPEETPETILRRFAEESELDARVWNCLKRSAGQPIGEHLPNVENHLLANNATAVSAAASAARELGLHPEVIDAESPETTAEEVAAELVEKLSTASSGTCLIWGGEPVVRLVAAESRGKGGRNQQLALAALQSWDRLPTSKLQYCIVSGGTDGEDGPTDAAGAVVDQTIVDAVGDQQLDVGAFLKKNDAYPFFESVGGLVKTGPTHTNVCDLRIAIAD